MTVPPDQEAMGAVPEHEQQPSTTIWNMGQVHITFHVDRLLVLIFSFVSFIIGVQIGLNQK